MSVGKVSIDRIRLDEAFVGKMLHRPFKDCIDAKSDETLFVVDDIETKISRFGNEEDDLGKALMVINENKREIVLLSIDNQLLTGIQGGIADCALFDDKQFRFVEFKTNAGGNSKKNFDKATQQLKNTIKVFKDKLLTVNIQFEDAVVLSCHIVVSHSFPRTQATIQDYQLKFSTDTNGILLSFNSETHWEELDYEWDRIPSNLYCQLDS